MNEDKELKDKFVWVVSFLSPLEPAEAHNPELFVEEGAALRVARAWMREVALARGLRQLATSVQTADIQDEDYIHDFRMSTDCWATVCRTQIR